MLFRSLSCALFKSLAKIDLLMIPYKGNSLAVTSVISGETSLVFGGIAQSAPQIKSGRVRAIGVTSLKRTPVMKEVPAIAETGLPGYEVSTWYGLFAPAATPRAIVERLNAAMAKALGSAAVIERIHRLSIEPRVMSARDFDTFLRNDVETARRMVKAAGLENLRQ